MTWTKTRLTGRLSLRYPIVQGPFGGGLSTAALAAAVSNEGGLGSFGAHAQSPAEVARTVGEIRQLTPGPFAINFWVPQPGEPRSFAPGDHAPHLARLRPYLRELGLSDPEPPDIIGHDFAAQVEAALEAGAPVLSFVFGVPPEEVLAAARARGVATIGAATTVDEAIALDRAGLDLIVATGSDAGGHRVAFLRAAEESLVGTLSLVPQVVDAVRAPVIAAGGIGDGRGVVAALALGAAGAQVGTTFLATDESGASEPHRSALSGPGARETRLTRVFSGRLARGIVNRLMLELQPHEGSVPPYPLQNWLTQVLRREAARQGRPDLLALWAGQAAALSVRRPAREAFRSLVAGVESTLTALGDAGASGRGADGGRG